MIRNEAGQGGTERGGAGWGGIVLNQMWVWWRGGIGTVRKESGMGVA